MSTPLSSPQQSYRTMNFTTQPQNVLMSSQNNPIQYIQQQHPHMNLQNLDIQANEPNPFQNYPAIDSNEHINFLMQSQQDYHEFTPQFYSSKTRIRNYIIIWLLAIILPLTQIIFSSITTFFNHCATHLNLFLFVNGIAYLILTSYFTYKQFVSKYGPTHSFNKSRFWRIFPTILGLLLLVWNIFGAVQVGRTHRGPNDTHLTCNTHVYRFAFLVVVVDLGFIGLGMIAVASIVVVHLYKRLTERPPQPQYR